MQRLLATERHASAPRIVGITSLLPGEGRTLLAANLAGAAAASGLRTLLVDGSRHHPALTRGLAGDAAPSGLLQSTQPGGFAFLPLAPASDDPALPALDAATIASFDAIFVDLPPLVADADPRAAAERMDAILLVIDWNRVSSEELAAALALNAPLRERLVGTVLNRVRFTRADRLFQPEMAFLARRQRFGAGRAKP